MDLQKEKILNTIILGLELEFFSNKSKKEIARELGNLLRKKIKVGESYHSKIEVDANNWKIEKDYSGGSKMCELVTGPMPYREAIACMYKILGWMKQNAWTDEKCSIQANISFDKFRTDLTEKIESINRMKYVLGFDEEFVYEKFPKRKNNIYARSINSIFPINKFVFNDNITHVFKENYELPNEKFYGINFSKLSKGYLEIRYMGGRGYEKVPHAIKEVIDYISVFTYDVLKNNNAYTNAEIARLKNEMKSLKKVVSSFIDYEAFCLNYPNMRLLVDLKGERQIMKTFYPQIRDKVFELIVKCGMRRGVINYDADFGRYQVKGAVFSKAFSLQGMEVFDSKVVSGNVLDCDLYRCELNNAHLLDCNIFQGNKINKSKIINSPFHAYNDATDCYIDNHKTVINGKVTGGIIRSGDVGPLAKISDETEIIKKKSAGSKDGIQIDKKGGTKDKHFEVTPDGFRPDIKS